MQLYCDNKLAIDVACNLVQHDETTHVGVDRYLIKEKIENKIICMPFVKSEDQLIYRNQGDLFPMLIR